MPEGITMRLSCGCVYATKTHFPWQLISRLIILLFLAGILGSPSAAAKDFYISENGTGGGTSCTGTLSASWFNNSANWGSGSAQIGPGTTVHLCGTFVGTAGQTMLTFQGSGASGNPITLLFESGANLTAPYWSTSGAINTNGNTWLVINGDAAGGRQGIIQATANGSSLANQQNTIGIFADRCSNCVFENLTIANLYVHNSSSDTAISAADGIRFFYNATNLTLTNILCHDAHWCFGGTGSNFTLSNSEIYNVDHGVADAMTGAGTLTNVNIYGNHFHDYAAWDTSANSYHHDGIHIWANSGAQVSGGNIYNNLFDGDVGANITAHVYIETVVGNGVGTYASNIKVFNNVFLPTSTARNYRAIWFCGDGGNPSGNSAYNNFINTGSNSYAAVHVNGQTSVIVENNIIMAAGNGSSDIVLTSGTTVGTVDYNTYLSNTGGNTFVWQSSFIGSLATWLIACNCDAHSSLVTSIQINATSGGHLLSGSVAIGSGADLTALGITALDFDKAGNPRPASGPWTMGAFNGPNTPNPPANLQVTVQ